MKRRNNAPKAVAERWAEEKILRSEAKIQKQLSHPHHKARHHFSFWLSSILIAFAYGVIAVILIPIFLAASMFLLGLLLAITALIGGLLYYSSLSNIRHLGRSHHVTTFLLPAALGIYVMFLLAQATILVPEQLLSAGMITGMMFIAPRVFQQHL